MALNASSSVFNDPYFYVIAVPALLIALETFLLLFLFLKKKNNPDCASFFVSFLFALKAPTIAYYTLDLSETMQFNYIECNGGASPPIMCFGNARSPTFTSFPEILMSHQIISSLIFVVYVTQSIQWFVSPLSDLPAATAIPVFTTLAALFSVTTWFFLKDVSWYFTLAATLLTAGALIFIQIPLLVERGMATAES